MIAVTHDRERRTFATRIEGRECYLRYVPAGEGLLDYATTFVPEPLRGRGIASALVQEALDHARAEGYRVIPSCWFVRDFLIRHPEYADLTAER